MRKLHARHFAALLAGAIRRAAGAGMSRDIGLVLVFKFAALGVLWALFFSDAHQPSADPLATSRRLALTPAAGATAITTHNPLEERLRD
jgi:predicted exporter